jgi:hypothetical protein
LITLANLFLIAKPSHHSSQISFLITLPMAYSTPEALLSPINDETMSRSNTTAQNGATNQSSRKRKATEQPEDTFDTAYDQYTAATDEEKQAWQGFCEIESDPVSHSPSRTLSDPPPGHLHHHAQGFRR